jgi:hypothetical protein
VDPARALVTSPTIRNDSPPAVDDWAMVVLIKNGGIPVIVSIAGPTTGVTTTLPASGVPTVFLAANPARLGATINNNSTNRFLYVKLGAGVGLSSYSVRLGPHSYYELPFPAYTGVIEGIWGPGVGGFATITELT